MTKTELLGALENLLRNFIFGNVLIRIGASQDVSHLQHEIIRFESPRSHAEVKLGALFTGVSSLVTQRPRLVSEFQGSLRRAAVAEYFECMKCYCADTSQEAGLKAASWYDFVRVIRNTTSHGRGGYISWPPEFKKKGIKSVSWRHLVIDETMEKTPLILFDSDIVLLLADIRNYAGQSLK